MLYTAVVISRNQFDIPKLLAPYQRNNMNTCPKEFMYFEPLSEFKKKEYLTGVIEKVILPDGTFIDPWDEKCYKTMPKDEYINSVIELGEDDDEFQLSCIFMDDEVKIQDFSLVAGELINVPLCQLYHTTENYYKSYCCAIYDNDLKDWGDWYNPNERWERWSVGDSWSRQIQTISGDLVYTCQLKDAECFKSKQKYTATRFWEINVEGQPLTSDENEEDFINFETAEYLTNYFGSKEKYAYFMVTSQPYALITPDGDWYDKNDGPFRFENSTKESTDTFIKILNKVISEVNQEYWITIVTLCI